MYFLAAVHLLPASAAESCITATTRANDMVPKTPPVGATADLQLTTRAHHIYRTKATRVLLQHFASDQTATSILKNGGKSYSEIAAKELPMLHDNWTRFCAYLWPAASEERLKLIAETIVYIFIFDGKRNLTRNITTLITSGTDVWEMSDESTVSRSKLLRLHIFNS